MSDKQIKENNSSQNDDYEVILRVLDGEVNAFGILQKKYRAVISSLIRKMVKDEDDIDDLVQETFIKAYRAIDRYKSDFTFSAWIYRIASNTCIDFLRKKRLNIFSIDQPINASNDEDEDMFYDIEDDSYQPDIDLMNKERLAALKNAIDNLPDKYKIIIKLRHEEEMDYNEIALKLDMPLGTVKAHLFRARKILFDDLKKINYMFTD